MMTSTNFLKTHNLLNELLGFSDKPYIFNYKKETYDNMVNILKNIKSYGDCSSYNDINISCNYCLFHKTWGCWLDTFKDLYKDDEIKQLVEMVVNYLSILVNGEFRYE